MLGSGKERGIRDSVQSWRRVMKEAGNILIIKAGGS
jgi:hypothetical protein